MRCFKIMVTGDDGITRCIAKFGSREQAEKFAEGNARYTIVEGEWRDEGNRLKL